ncbi:MAG: response regulator transcription factor [Intrasporangium sp.]|uniref:response regulator n=1 Tax=Intrasporangium sp. TaxID=1925024 RepID=UPI002648C2D7|nr:response regulator transcription factor [Intrasporangium sp.]MDN5796803.1 response regulator transcription factor [Intrasporangium sp.]
MPITVYLLDDHEIVRRGLRELLESTGDIAVIGESGLAHEAARRIPALRPDVAIFDVRLPDGSGIDACREVRSIDPTIKGLVLTSFDDESALSMAVMAGAHGFVLKDIKGAGLVAAVRRIAAGEHLIDEEQLARLRRAWLRHEESDPRLRSLSPQERRILDLIAAGKTNRQIGEVLSIAEKTVKNYVTSILGKLGLESRTQAAVLAATRGHDHGHRGAWPPTASGH